MPKLLSADAIAQFAEEGYYSPLRILDGEQAASYRAQLENFEKNQGKPVGGAQRSKSHLLFKWVDELMRHEQILNAVEDLIGPDILCWNTFFWIKEAGSQTFVSWHQDLRYWGLDTNDLVTAWLALSPATLESGCMRVLPGSHKDELLPHSDEYRQDNLLTRGQEIAVQVDENETVGMPLQSGEMSLHNVRLAHASGDNNAPDRRIGVSMHFMPTDTQQIVGEWDSAALVRGEDTFGNFAPTPIPEMDFDPVAMAFHVRAQKAQSDVLYTGAAVNTKKL